MQVFKVARQIFDFFHSPRLSERARSEDLLIFTSVRGSSERTSGENKPSSGYAAPKVTSFLALFSVHFHNVACAPHKKVCAITILLQRPLYPLSYAFVPLATQHNGRYFYRAHFSNTLKDEKNKSRE